VISPGRGAPLPGQNDATLTGLIYLLSSWCRNAATAGSRVGGGMQLVTWKRKQGEVGSAEEFSADS